MKNYYEAEIFIGKPNASSTWNLVALKLFLAMIVMQIYQWNGNWSIARKVIDVMNINHQNKSYHCTGNSSPW